MKSENNSTLDKCPPSDYDNMQDGNIYENKNCVIIALLQLTIVISSNQNKWTISF